MHASSLENMYKCYERYVGSTALLDQASIKVIDIGGANVNGSYADIFSDDKFKYVAVDLEAGPGIDVVLQDPYKYPFETDSVDVVISGQAFEHAEFFWLLFEEMTRVLKPNGLIFLIVPSAGPIHRFPVDCYRFYPDSMSALAKYTNVNLVTSWLDDRGPWNDLVSVFSPQVIEDSQVPGETPPSSRYGRQYDVAPLFIENVDPAHNRIKGEAPYLNTLEQFHSALKPELYLEIGVRQGNSLKLATCPAIAVDPQPDVSYPLPEHHKLYEIASDHFFEFEGRDLLETTSPDLAMIDGMHLFEFVLRDFINLEKISTPSTVVIIDDIYPNHPVQATRKRQSRVWTGDVWKFYECLKEIRPELVLLPIDTSPTGLLMVTGLDRKNRVLSERYNPIVRRFREMDDEAKLQAYIDRQGAVSPSDSLISSLCNELAQLKQQAATPVAVRRSLLGMIRAHSDHAERAIAA